MMPRPSDTGTGHKDSFNVINSYNTTHVDEEPQILKWLSPLEPRFRHQDVRTSRLDGIGDWFLESDEFVNWRNGEGEADKAILFCSGDPGVGKTYLSSLVIDALCEQVVGKRVAVACFYCDYQSAKEQTPENMLGAIAKQLVRGLGAIPSEIDEAFQKAKSQIGGRGLRVPEVLKHLEAALAPLDRAFICIDALDECLGKNLPEFLRSLHAISQWSPGIRFFITGRPHVRAEIEKYFSGGAQCLQITPTREDIVRYLEWMLDNDPVPEAMNPSLKTDIIRLISDTISDVFLLVSLRIASILGEATIRRRRDQLKEMTKGRGLGDAYRVTLDRMKSQGEGKSRLGITALMWISRSERAMRTDELRDALGVETGSTDHDPESIPSIQTLLASCLGLITVDKEDKEESTVRFVHFTLQEYLDSHSEIFQNPYSTMAEVCLTYLNFDCVNKLPLSLPCAPETTPFLKYSSMYWGHYARNETTERVKSLALQLLNRYDGHISAKLLLQPEHWRLRRSENQPKGFVGIHCVAYLGIDEILIPLLESKDWDLDSTDWLGYTPLIWATRNGHEGVVKILLDQQNANPNTTDTRYGRTPLSHAAEWGREGVVKLLLERDGVNLESQDKDGRTPLSHAAEWGREGVVKLLLERDEVNPESQDKDGRTPLSHAAEGGSEGVVKLLLERDEVNLESQDKDGRTALSHAAEGGSEGVVKLLLERDEVNPESQDRGGRTPLSHAAGYVDGCDNEGVVKLLLERDEVNPESQDNGGRTPLSHAADGGSEGIVKILLERDEVNPESQDKDGRTPLSHAAECGSAGVVRLLLERKEVNPESRDEYGQTPLSYAIEGGHQMVAQRLRSSLSIVNTLVEQSVQTPGLYTSEHARELVPVLQHIPLPSVPMGLGFIGITHAPRRVGRSWLGHIRMPIYLGPSEGENLGRSEELD